MARKLDNISIPVVMRAIGLLLMAFRMTRVILAQHSILFFAWYYLGITLALHQEFWAYKFLRSRKHVMMSARGHGKSKTISEILSLWLIMRNRNIRILLVAVTGGPKSPAFQHAMVIRGELESNQKLINDFGKFYDIKQCNIWHQDCFQVIRDGTLKDPTLEAVGIFGSITGGRFDIMIFDDVIDLKLVHTPGLMAKVEAEIKGTFLPLLEPEGRAFAIGTRKHFGDIYSFFLKNPLWTSTQQAAIIREPADWEIVQLEKPIIRDDGTEQFCQAVIHGDDRGECLWPEKWPMEKLLLLRYELGSVVFNREYQNEVIDDETALFRLSWLEQCRDESMSYVAGILTDEVRTKYRIIIHSVDPSLVTDKKAAQKQDSDYMVQTAIGLRHDGTRELLAIDRDRGLSPKQVEARIIAFYTRIKPFRCVIERNAFGLIHAHNLIEDTDMKIIKHHTGQNKNDAYEGIPHLSALFENVKMRLPYKTDADKKLTDSLMAEFHAFGSDIHDDQVMSVWIGEYAILRYLKGQARIRRVEKQQTIRR